jgi:hypothetical protein
MIHMPSFQTTISPNRRAAARFIGQVRRAIQKAYVEEQRKNGTSQSDIARAIGVHRSVINRELKGLKDITLGRVAELAWALGRNPTFTLEQQTTAIGQNITPVPVSIIAPSPSVTTTGRTVILNPTLRKARVA